MATEDEITELRQMVAETEDDSTWTDDELAVLIDSEDSLNAAASKVWYLKAGRAASLVDVAESGSSRKLSDIRKNAMEMGAYYKAADEAEEAATTDTASHPVVQRIRRTVA